MKDLLTLSELKALCSFFFECGQSNGAHRDSSANYREIMGIKSQSFNDVFNELMQGKYDNLIKNEGLKIKLEEMQEEVDKHMDKFDLEEKKRAGQAIQDLRSIFIH